MRAGGRARFFNPLGLNEAYLPAIGGIVGGAAQIDCASASVPVMLNVACETAGAAFT